jgi:hypothetical protein
MEMNRQARQEKHNHKLHGGGISTEFKAYSEEERGSSKLALAHIAVPVNFTDILKIHTSKAFVFFSYYSNISCFGPARRNQVYKL